MAYISALANLRYDLNKYIVELRRVSNLAATFLIKNELTKLEYLSEIENDINYYEFKFNNEHNPNKKRELLFEFKKVVELANKEYQILRTKDHVTYYVTDVFEDHGVIKYAKIAGGVVAGSLELFAAKYYFKLSETLNIKSFRGVSVVFAAYGANNIYEAMTPVLFEHASPGLLRLLYQEGAEIIGLNTDDGDLAYSFVELSLSIYAGIRKPIVTQNAKRLADPLIGDAPGTGKLFKYTHTDYTPSWNRKNTIMRLWFLGYSGYKAEMLFTDDKHLFSNKYN